MNARLLLRLSRKSILSRRATTFLTLASVALSVMLLLGIERIKTGALRGFQNTASGTDLIVGARTSGIQLLLFSVFHVGYPANNISPATYQHFATHPEVSSSVPISLGDSHRGFRVVGTTSRYFDFFMHHERALSFDAGRRFQGGYEAVIGSDVADSLGYSLQTSIILSHGIQDVSLIQHSKNPFVVVGILTPTGSPIDRSVFVPLEAIDHLHEDMYAAANPENGTNQSASSTGEISAFFVKTRSRMGMLQLQREINDYNGEALTAIIPGRTLQDLWSIMSMAEKSLTAISLVAFAVSLIGLVLTFVSTLNERRREMAILRSLGASPRFIFGLLIFEAGILATLGCLLGFLCINGLLYVFQPLLENRLGLDLVLLHPTYFDAVFMVSAVGAAMLVASFPAWHAYRNSLADGLTVRT